MRHLREVEEHGPPRDVLAEPYRERPIIRVGVRLKYVTKRNLCRPGVRNLNTYRALARYRGEYPDLGRGEGVGDVLLQIPDLADLHPAAKAHLVAGYARSDHGPHDMGLDPEIRERLRETLAGALGVVLGIPMPEIQDREGRRRVLPWCKLPFFRESLSQPSLGQHDLELPRRRALLLDRPGLPAGLLVQVPHTRSILLLLRLRARLR